MPDSEGRIKGIVVPELPWQRDEAKPEPVLRFNEPGWRAWVKPCGDPRCCPPSESKAKGD